MLCKDGELTTSLGSQALYTAGPNHEQAHLESASVHFSIFIFYLPALTLPPCPPAARHHLRPLKTMGETHRPPGRGPSSLSFENEDLDARSRLARTDWMPSASSLLCRLHSGRTRRRATWNFHSVDSISTHSLHTCMLSTACSRTRHSQPRTASCLLQQPAPSALSTTGRGGENELCRDDHHPRPFSPAVDTHNIPFRKEHRKSMSDARHLLQNLTDV